MLTSDLLLAAKTLLENLKTTRGSMDSLNSTFIVAMSDEDPINAVRNLFPMIIESSEKSAAMIAEAFLAVNWEDENNKPQYLYDILSGVQTEVPDDIKELVSDHLSHMSTGTEAEMIFLFGPDPMMSCIKKLDLLDELSSLINERDETQALMAALQHTPEVPLVTQE